VHTGNRAPRDGKQWTTSLSEVSATAGGTGCIWALGGDNTDKDNNDTFLSIAVMWLSWSSSHRLMSFILTRMRSKLLGEGGDGCRIDDAGHGGDAPC
jgi:hypothetical protein